MPLSHDEVVHGKGSLLGKMPGDRWQKFANLRLLYAYMWSQPGKKLLFMGGELAQWSEWNHDASLDWHLLDDAAHRQIQLLVGELNRLYRDASPRCTSSTASRRASSGSTPTMPSAACWSYERIAQDEQRDHLSRSTSRRCRASTTASGSTRAGLWSEILNTDAGELGGSGHGNLGGVEATPVRAHGRPFSLNLTVPPLGAVFLRR